jgi:tellurite methyltransferase
VSDADREKWDHRYATGSHGNRDHPSAFLAEWEARLPPGHTLDVACGTGRNSLFLAAAGRRVDAVDVSRAGLARARRAAAERGLDNIELIEADLETDAARALQGRRYALVVWVRYVNRALLPRLAAALDDGGMILVEQHLLTAAEVVGPRTPEFRYAPNELLRGVMELADPVLRVLFYSESVTEDPDGRRVALARLVACRGRGPF